MKLKKFLITIFMMTVMSLIYIQMQVNIYALAYNGKEKEKEIFKLVDDNGYVIYNIAKLKSANHLGLELLTDRADVDFLGYDRIVELKTSEAFAEETRVASTDPQKRGMNLLAGIFSLKSEAEAKPIR